MRPLKSVISRIQAKQFTDFSKTRYAKKLRKLKDIHKGERCFVIGNGPSLAAEDLNTLAKNNEITFGMNRIYKIFDKTDWRPTYYACEDVNIFHDSIDEINALSSKIKFIPINVKWFNGIKIKDAYYFKANYNRELDFPYSFSTEIDKQLDSRGTVTFTCMCIAAYMGFKEIYLLGVDHNYRVTINELGETVVDENSKDYFCEGYDDDIKDQVIHDMRNNTRCYNLAKQFAEKNGIKIYNATRGGKLEIFERMDFDKLIGDNRLG
ncbi:MAG: DUF115 domain-containing protein [Clostridiales bacterium]|nr:DUF115 domain-containing protein [Clostridiales bacterium]